MVMRRELSQEVDVNMLMTTTLNSALYRRSPGRTQIWMNAALYRGSSRSANVDVAARFVTRKRRSSLQKARIMTSISSLFRLSALNQPLQERCRNTFERFQSLATSRLPLPKDSTKPPDFESSSEQISGSWSSFGNNDARSGYVRRNPATCVAPPETSCHSIHKAVAVYFKTFLILY
jgi:hypothetical protein